MLKLMTTAAVLIALVAPALAGKNNVPVYVGGNDGLDACMSSGTVIGLDPNGDGWLAVKSGPGLNFARVDVLYNGQNVSICDQVGPWMAVVYSKRRQDCGVSTPLRHKPYVLNVVSDQALANIEALSFGSGINAKREGGLRAPKSINSVK